MLKDQTTAETVTAEQGPAFNPFSMMLAPEKVLQRMERSSQLGALRKRVLRPLDHPWILRTAAAKISKESAAADAAIEKQFGHLN